MLVLTRLTDESIQIGEDIEIVILSAGRGRVRLGIKAPKDVSVRRHNCKQREPQAARETRSVSDGPVGKNSIPPSNGRAESATPPKSSSWERAS